MAGMHHDAPTMFETGTQNLAVVTVLADAIEWLDEVGWEWIEDRERALATQLRGLLRELPSVRVLTPDAWEHSSAITSFTMEGQDALALQKTLWEQGIITRWVPEHNGIRISTPYFTAEDELDRLIAALGRIESAGRG